MSHSIPEPTKGSPPTIPQVPPHALTPPLLTPTLTPPRRITPTTPLLLINPHPSTLLLLLRQRLDIPDLLRILIDAPITREESHSRHASDTLRNPLLLVRIRLVDELVRVDVGGEVVRHEVVVAVVADGGDHAAEALRVAELAGLDGLEDLVEGGVDGVVLPVGVRVAEVLDVFGEVAEEEDVVLADFAGDFDL